MQTALLKIGTRGSPLALYQAHETRRRLAVAHGLKDDEIHIEVIKTSGDRIQDRALSQAGGKGLFTKEIEEALLAGTIDLAVHSSKDMPTKLPDGLALTAFLPREDVRDAFISRQAKSLRDLPKGAKIGSASLRRQALIKRLRPDLEVELIRGNVETRIAKVESGEFAATLLALAGLKRLGLDHHAASVLDIDEFPPAVGQGAICIESRSADERVLRMLAPINDQATMTELTTERAFLAVLDGSCRTPIAGHARLLRNELRFRGMVLTDDGSDAVETSRSGAPGEGERMGREAGEDLKRQARPGMLAHL